jgi:hypothetical protein
MSFIHPSAKVELEEAALYYSDISLALAEQFLSDFEQTLSFVESVPNAWSNYFFELKKLNFKVFPFSIIYRIEETKEITIVAIQHHSRKPFYWQERL